MLDLNTAFDLKRQHEERVEQLAYDYQQGQKAQKAIVAFINQNWQRLLQKVNKRLGGLSPQTPELHY